MSSSSAVRKRAATAPSEAKPFPYVQAEQTGGETGTGSTIEERNVREHTEAIEQGRQLGLKASRAELEAAVQQEREQIARAIHEFTNERQNYYRRIEGEVSQLALAIARKVLHRETQLDPQALAGLVRVTLEKLDAETRVVLHVPPKEAADWRHYFACRTDGVTAPEVHEDPALAPGECRVETSLGSSEVGFESQLKEIETGFLDLLAARPGSK